MDCRRPRGSSSRGTASPAGSPAMFFRRRSALRRRYDGTAAAARWERIRDSGTKGGGDGGGRRGERDDKKKNPPPPSPFVPASPPCLCDTNRAPMLALEDYRLDNGLRVVLNEDHSAPLVAVNLWYHVGSKNERPGRTGFAHLFEHMLFSGSEHVGNNEHFRYVQSVGGNLNGTTFFDRTNYFETLPSNYLALGLWLESDRMGYFLPALTQEKLDIQREVVKEERRQRYDNVPYGTAFERLLHLAYDPDYSYHWPTIGSMEDLGAASLDDIREFFATWYRPDNATLTVIGDFAPDEAKQLVEHYFGSIPAGKSFPKFNLERKPLNGERREVFPSPVQLPRVYRLYHFPKMGHPDWMAADLLSSVLSGDKASRLEKALVLEQQIATDVSAYVLPTEATGIFMMQAT